MRSTINKYSIEILYPDNKLFYTGKVIGDTYFRNLKFNKAVLWSDREFGLNVEILNHLKEKGIKNIVYIDTALPDHAYKISLEKFDKLKVLKEFSFGKQYFVKVDAARKIKEPKVPYIVKSIVIEAMKV